MLRKTPSFDEACDDGEAGADGVRQGCRRARPLPAPPPERGGGQPSEPSKASYRGLDLELQSGEPSPTSSLSARASVFRGRKPARRRTRRLRPLPSSAPPPQARASACRSRPRSRPHPLIRRRSRPHHPFSPPQDGLERTVRFQTSRPGVQGRVGVRRGIHKRDPRGRKRWL